MPVVAEYAKSNRSSCKSCSKKIAVKSLRLGLISKGPGGVDMTRWHHFDCFPTDSESIASVDDIQGLSVLEKQDQDALTKLVEQCGQEPAKKTIVSKDLRVGLVTRDARGFDVTSWHHLGCFPIDWHPIDSVEDVGGYSSLEKGDQKELQQLAELSEKDTLIDDVQKMDEGEDESVADNEITEETKKGKHSSVAKLVEQPGEPAKEVNEDEEIKNPASDEISGQKIKETTGSPDSSKVISEYAKSSRSTCKKCSQTIAAKELRLGLVTRNFRGFDMTQWHHVGCFPVDSDPIGSIEDIGGFSELQSGDQDALKELVQQCGKRTLKMDEDNDESEAKNKLTEETNKRKHSEVGELMEKDESLTKAKQHMAKTHKVNISESTSQVEVETEISLSASDVKDKYRDANLVPKWKAFETVIFLERDDGLNDSEKIAAFDFDGCLAKTSVKIVGADAWSLMYPSIPEKLQSLYNQGYKLVIFTNESNIDRWKNKRQAAVDFENWTSQQFYRAREGPHSGVIACGVSSSVGKGGKDDLYRKPKAGMWQLMKKHFNSGIAIDMDKSFYVGDAAGRKMDHSDADIKFATGEWAKVLYPGGILYPRKVIIQSVKAKIPLASSDLSRAFLFTCFLISALSFYPPTDEPPPSFFLLLPANAHFAMAKRIHLTELGCIACEELSELGAGKEGPDLSPIEAESITAIEWLVFDDVRVVVAGTSCGYLLVTLLPMVHPSRILKIRVRGTKKDLMQETSSEEICIVLPGIIARFDGSNIQSMLQKWFQEKNSNFWDQKNRKGDPEDSGSFVPTTTVSDMECQQELSSQRYYCAVTIGEDAVISAISNDQSPKRKPEAKTQAFARASSLTCIKDYPRKGEKLTLSPSGTLAAITDSLGRILLLDTQALVVVRLWKGYRDASCVFMEMLAKKDKGKSVIHTEPVKSDYCLCLAIHAPRKGIIEVWQMRTGPRLLTIQCAKGSKLLQPAYRFGSNSSSPYILLKSSYSMEIPAKSLCSTDLSLKNQRPKAKTSWTSSLPPPIIFFTVSSSPFHSLSAVSDLHETRSRFQPPQFSPLSSLLLSKTSQNPLLATSKFKNLPSQICRQLNHRVRIEFSTMTLATLTLNHRFSPITLFPLTAPLENSPKSSSNSNPPAKEDNLIGFGVWLDERDSDSLCLSWNVYRAVLEVYVSFHENDEFWYGNLPNDYVTANNLSVAGNGPFREVVVSLDGEIAGAVWPFPVVFTGGINPLLWRPITAIGSFDLPSYDIEITPFLGSLLDGKTHKVGFSVTNALNVWYIDANLHLWLDREKEIVEGKVLEFSRSSLEISSVSDFKGLNGNFTTKAKRSITSIGLVKSSHGDIITNANQEFSYENKMVLGKDGNMQIIDQLIQADDRIHAKRASRSLYCAKSIKSFPFYLDSDSLEQQNNTSLEIANVKMAI
ncbi:unnamed protein product [Arabidopsis arenosa]|uniref:PARP-type domain-containing protein n=1 Tax=Arabidopsis arenosa TaxID=38785 RepID=A0A8S1ZWA9_ARAAE|nr:unnamed protein product [Arabidopsis arenosa]